MVGTEVELGTKRVRLICTYSIPHVIHRTIIYKIFLHKAPLRSIITIFFKWGVVNLIQFGLCPYHFHISFIRLLYFWIWTWYVHHEICLVWHSTLIEGSFNSFCLVLFYVTNLFFFWATLWLIKILHYLWQYMKYLFSENIFHKSISPKKTRVVELKWIDPL